MFGENRQLKHTTASVKDSMLCFVGSSISVVKPRSFYNGTGQPSYRPTLKLPTRMHSCLNEWSPCHACL